MKFIIDNWMLFAIALASGALLLQPILQDGMAQGLSTASAVNLMNREKAVVIDLSTAQEFAQGHLTGAVHVEFTALESDLPRRVSDKSRPIILCCPTGGVSAKALVVAKKLGFTNVHVLGGGLRSWRDANLPLLTA